MSSKSRRTTTSPPGFPTYKYVSVTCETVESAVDGVVYEVGRLITECRYAASRFPSPDHVKAIGFEAAADRLAEINLESSLIDDLDHGVLNQPLEYQVQVCRRKAHIMARWARANNCARALIAAAVAISAGSVTTPGSVDYLLKEAAAQLMAIEFPKLYD